MISIRSALQPTQMPRQEVGSMRSSWNSGISQNAKAISEKADTSFPKRVYLNNMLKRDGNSTSRHRGLGDTAIRLSQLNIVIANQATTRYRFFQKNHIRPYANELTCRDSRQPRYKQPPIYIAARAPETPARAHPGGARYWFPRTQDKARRSSVHRRHAFPHQQTEFRD